MNSVTESSGNRHSKLFYSSNSFRATFYPCYIGARLSKKSYSRCRCSRQKFWINIGHSRTMFRGTLMS